MTRYVLTAGLGYGDEGKGSTIDFLTRYYCSPLVVRYNGGAQAGHNVYTNNGRFHCFSQFGAGTFAGAKTYLSKYVLVNPIFAFAEANHLIHQGIDSPFDLLYVDRKAVVTTPYHVALNRLKELTRSFRHGSCGMGIGETMDYSLRFPDKALLVEDLEQRDTAIEKLNGIKHYCYQALTQWISQLNMDWDEMVRFGEADEASTGRDKQIVNEVRVLVEDPVSLFEQMELFAHQAVMVEEDWFKETSLSPFDDTILFEGAQGVLLDQDYGFVPHVTWTDTTFGNAEKLLEGMSGLVQKLGITRSYATRHGNGPFVTEDRDNNLLHVFSDEDNRRNDWQSSFRVGPLDFVTMRYALDTLGGVDGIVLTRMDSWQGRPFIPYCDRYVRHEGETEEEAGVFVDLFPGTELFVPAHMSQEGLTEVLYDSEPILERIPTGALPILVKTLTNTPVVLTSHGKTAATKHPQSGLLAKFNPIV